VSKLFLGAKLAPALRQKKIRDQPRGPRAGQAKAPSRAPNEAAARLPPGLE
jgi:hypothetical protein